MRVCILKSTGQMVESQDFATKGTLINNMKQYYSESDLEEQEVNQEEYEALKLALPQPTQTLTLEERITMLENLQLQQEGVV